MKVSSNRMKLYPEAGQKLLPRTPVVVEVLPKALDPSVFKNGKLMPEVLCSVCGCLENSVFGYTDFSSCTVLLADYPGWDSFAFRDPQELSSLAAACATASAAAYGVLFTSKSFNLPKDEVINYFIWKQATLAGNLLKSDGSPLTAESVADMVEFGPISMKNNWPGTWWRGRACNKAMAPVSADSTSQEPEWFWDIDTETPSFSRDRDYITSKIYLPRQ